MAEASPNDARTQFWLGNAYGANIVAASTVGKMRMGPKLRAAFTRALELDPNNLGARFALVQLHTPAPGVIGGSLDTAREHAAQIGKRDPYRGHVARGAILQAEKKPADSAKEYESAYRMRPRDPEARLMLGLAYQDLERWTDAAAHFRV